MGSPKALLPLWSDTFVMALESGPIVTIRTMVSKTQEIKKLKTSSSTTMPNRPSSSKRPFVPKTHTMSCLFTLADAMMPSLLTPPTNAIKPSLHVREMYPYTNNDGCTAIALLHHDFILAGYVSGELALFKNTMGVLHETARWRTWEGSVLSNVSSSSSFLQKNESKIAFPHGISQIVTFPHFPCAVFLVLDRAGTLSIWDLSVSMEKCLYFHQWPIGKEAKHIVLSNARPPQTPNVAITFADGSIEIHELEDLLVSGLHRDIALIQHALT